MTPQHVISQLLEADAAKQSKNIALLKKIILTCALGQLRINGMPPDNQIALGSYLFDNERIMFDFTRLSEEQRGLFEKWLLEEHEADKDKKYLSSSSVNEHRGLTAEQPLSLWGRFVSWIQGQYADRWHINKLDLLSLNYQLLSMDMIYGQYGTSIGFEQFLVPSTGVKYKALHDAQKEPLGNTKRVYITPDLVDKLQKLKLDTVQFGVLCKKPHPLAVHVYDVATRYQRMFEYRTIHAYVPKKPWYARFWSWLISLFRKNDVTPRKEVPPAVNNTLQVLHEDETSSVYQRAESSEILIKEKRPDVENLVLCGGGPKIFGHIGVWKALNEYNIKPKKFAGSSAGAIMSLLCYLGFDADEIAELLKNFRHHNLVYFDISREGLSDSRAIKTAIDYAIALKIKRLVGTYKIPYPQGKITFATLNALKEQCPGCGIGEELIVTTTNRNLRKTTYCSWKKTPDMEVSEAIRASASFPVIYRHTVIDGEEHNDGGVLNNFPTNAFHADDSTFLESEYGNNMQTLAVQFDNGTERDTVDRVMNKVYRENFILNWIYGFLTGVRDPVSGWEEDRKKLRKYAAQSIIVPVVTTQSTNFSVDNDRQFQLIQNGYDAACDYLSVRYAKKEGGDYKSQEIMYTTFSSLEELLTYCCYRGNKYWFDLVERLIAHSALVNKDNLLSQASTLKELYFSGSPQKQPVPMKTLFGSHVLQKSIHHSKCKRDELLLALFPIFLKLPPEFLTDKEDKDLLEKARHAFTKATPFAALKHMILFSGTVHIAIHIFINLLRDLKNKQDEQTYNALSTLQTLLYDSQEWLNKPEYFGKWDLTRDQGIKVLELMQQKNPALSSFCNSLHTDTGLDIEEDKEQQISADDEYTHDAVPARTMKLGV